MTETPQNRIRRLQMRSSRRGIREMDLILSAFASGRLGAMGGDELDLYDALLQENDHDLYQWITGQRDAPARFRTLIQDIARAMEQAPRTP